MEETEIELDEETLKEYVRETICDGCPNAENCNCPISQ